MAGAGVKRIIFSSSAATYGIPKTVPIKEDDPTNPINPYGYTKLMMERMIGSYQKKFGILVNPQLKTSENDIYAAGDCVEIYHPGVKDYWINFGWPNALEQGAIAGKNMTGEDEEYKIHDTIIFNLMGKPLKARWWE